MCTAAQREWDSHFPLFPWESDENGSERGAVWVRESKWELRRGNGKERGLKVINAIPTDLYATVVLMRVTWPRHKQYALKCVLYRPDHRPI